jgi:hypothetical protein
MGKPDPKYYTAFRKYLREGDEGGQLGADVVSYIQSVAYDVDRGNKEFLDKDFDFEENFKEYMLDKDLPDSE